MLDWQYGLPKINVQFHNLNEIWCGDSYYGHRIGFIPESESTLKEARWKMEVCTENQSFTWKKSYAEAGIPNISRNN